MIIAGADRGFIGIAFGAANSAAAAATAIGAVAGCLHGCRGATKFATSTQHFKNKSKSRPTYVNSRKSVSWSAVPVAPI